MSKRKLFYWCFLFFSLHPGMGQVAPYTYWVEFTDKKGTPYSLDHPEEFLTERSLQRREEQNIKLDSTDLPINPAYIDSLINLGCVVHNTSKWLNGTVILSSDELLIDTLHHLSFVASPLKTLENQSGKYNKIEKYPESTKNVADYGYSERQIKMLHGESLHNLGYEGENIYIAVLDGGFKKVDDVESLSHLWDNNQIIAWKDFVNDGVDMFDAHPHGTIVLSLMAGIIPGNIYGTSPEASYILVRTEDTFSEYPVEEYNWVSGAEYADSLGTDVINSSLGYSIFDDSQYNHSYEDMDGKTTPASIGANMAARKGILVSVSAGNSGHYSSWGYITAPSDADSILTVGAVDSTEQIAYFSGRGTSFDGRVKPDVCAMGVKAYGQADPGMLMFCTGTSCSAPLIAGLSACLWQANPNATAQQIRMAILESAHHYSRPDTAYGYGIPDFSLANLLLKEFSKDPTGITKIKIVPNPILDFGYLYIELPWIKSSKVATIDFFDLAGSQISTYNQIFEPGYNYVELKLPNNLEKGHYILRMTIDERVYQAPLLKL